MPLFSRKTTPEIDFKARMERKLYLAREDPEPIFDLADCNLKAVPSGVFVLCKVLRKESLVLKNNQLSDLNGGGKLQDLTLLQILDLSCNRLKSLSTEIKHLVNLTELLLGQNRLTELPKELGNLALLEHLDVSNNCIKQVPEWVGRLPALRLLNLCSNPLTSLPEALQQPGAALQILTEPGVLPSRGKRTTSVTSTKVVEMACTKKDSASAQSKSSEISDGESEALLKLLESRRKKQAELIKRLASFEEHQQSTLATVLEHQKEQQTLAREVAQSEEDHLTALSCVREQEELRSSKLAHTILRDEEARQVALKDVLKREEARNVELAHAVAMEEETQRARLADVLSSLPERNAPLLQLVLQDEQLQLSVLEAVRMRQESLSGQLSQCVVQEEQLRQAALAVLWEKGDVHARKIAAEVASIQAQLGALTAAEVKRRNDRTNDAIVDLSDQRVTLSLVLCSLLEQQALRRRELLDQVAQQLEGVGEAIWLIQLQRLLDAPPPSLESSLPSLKALVSALPSKTDETATVAESPVVPSAPQRSDLSPGEEFTPSAPFSQEMECAICMDAQCTLVFLPCGHVCSCQKCALMLAECPLCRQEITNKIPLIWSC